MSLIKANCCRVFREIGCYFDAFVCRLVGKKQERQLKFFVAVQYLEVRCNFTGGKAGDVKEVIDDICEVFAGPFDNADIFNHLVRIIGSHFRICDDLGETDNRIERGAKLMGGVGKKSGLRTIGLVGLNQCRIEGTAHFCLLRVSGSQDLSLI